MNIFALNDDPWFAALDHCDVHVNKMLCESAQMLSFVHIAAGSNIVGHVYRNNKAHQNHPCTLWVKESRANYIWLYELALALYEQFQDRNGKLHKTGEEVLPYLETLPPGYASSIRTPFSLCMPEEFRTKDRVESYRNFYASKYFVGTSYKRAPMPLWLADKLGM